MLGELRLVGKSYSHGYAFLNHEEYLRQQYTKFACIWGSVWLVFLFVSLVFGSFLGLYHSTYWFDATLHFLSGVLLTIMAVQAFQVRTFVSVLLVGAIVGNLVVLWEVFEFAVDQMFGTVMQDGLYDTMSDMLLGKLGCLLVVINLRNKRVLR